MDSDGDVRMANASSTPPLRKTTHTTQQRRATSAPTSTRSTPYDLDDDLYTQEVANQADTPAGVQLMDCSSDDEVESLLGGIPDIFINDARRQFNTTSPPCAGEVFVSGRILTQVDTIRSLALQFGMSASVTFRAMYMYAYLIQQDGVSIHIAKALPLQLKTGKFSHLPSTDTILAYLCLYIVSEQVALEIAMAYKGFIATIPDNLTPTEVQHHIDTAWITQMRSSVCSIEPNHQSFTLPLDMITDTMLPESARDTLFQQVCEDWLSHQAMQIMQLFGWYMTGTLHPPSHTTNYGFSFGQWDPAMDTTMSFPPSSKWTTNLHWLSAQFSLMDDLANHDIIAYYLSINRDRVTMTFQERHSFIHFPTVPVNTNGILFASGQGRALIEQRRQKQACPVRRPRSSYVCSVSS